MPWWTWQADELPETLDKIIHLKLKDYKYAQTIITKAIIILAKESHMETDKCSSLSK